MKTNFLKILCQQGWEKANEASRQEARELVSHVLEVEAHKLALFIIEQQDEISLRESFE